MFDSWGSLTEVTLTSMPRPTPPPPLQALHRESQQYVPLRLLRSTVAGGVQQAQQAGRLEEGLPLGDVAAGAVHAVAVEAMPQQRGGQLDIRAQLQVGFRLFGLVGGWVKWGG